MELNDIQSFRISLASPEQVRAWSYGEVTKPETINYRRLRPEKDGLFCEAIFGPTKDFQCYCGKYKKVRFKGIVCDKCGVEVTHSRVRRERMGHIELATPIAHIWYTRRSPSYLGLMLNISQRSLDRVLYYAQYIISSVDENARERAAKRLEEDLERHIQRLKDEYQQKLDGIQAQVAEAGSDASDKNAEIEEQIQAERDAAIEALMSAATALQGTLDSLMGKPADKDYAFGDLPIVPAGEVVTREHRSTLNKLVQDGLTEVEERMAMQRDKLAAPQDKELSKLNREAEEQRATLAADLDTKLTAVREQFEADHEELYGLAVKTLLNETEYRELAEKWGRVFKASMGAEAVDEIASQIDLDEMVDELRTEIKTTRSKQRRKKAIKRLQVVEALRRSDNRPEWMIMKVLPVIPPALRPMVQLDGGRFATSDLNDLYRRVVNRNNRLKHLIGLQAPEVIIRNEKRMLQEAVDSLIDNSRRGKAISLRGRRQLKSLSDMLKGKQGRFRRNLLGKRVDYSGRSVIVVGPNLALHQCGLPKSMALELFRPFVMHKLVDYGYAINVKGAKRLIERQVPEVWAVLEEVIKTRPVLLNRAPTLHRLGIQAFEPTLVEGSAIHLHPLVCSAFNADFDGDQMAVHVPLSANAVREARELMLSSRNLLRPANGEPEVGPSKDMVMGCYYLTMMREGMKGEGMILSSFDETKMVYDLGLVHLHAKVTFQFQPDEDAEPEMIETSVGRILFNNELPEELRFINETLNKGGLKDLVAEGYKALGMEGTANLVDVIKTVGFRYAMISGTTIAIDDIHVPAEKATILEDVNARVAEVERQYRRGLITDNERYVKTVELWTEATESVTTAVAANLDPNSSLGIMVNSGSTKGGLQPIRQLAGMRGLMADPSGRIIALPIRSNFREGLTALEYFISTHGARKGLADTALRTADAGYLTRRLVDVAQDMIINIEDCGTSQGIWVTREDGKKAGESMAERIQGRYAAGPVVNPETGEIMVDAGEYIEEEMAKAIDATGIDQVYVRSPLSCSLRQGMCVKCYGRDLGRGGIVQIGEAVGIIAAQSIGEPGTQLTLRTFHTGGVAGGSDITQGLPRVQELFEARVPKGLATISHIGGMVTVRNEGDLRWVTVTSQNVERVEHAIPEGYEPQVMDEVMVQAGDILATAEDQPDILSKIDGRALVNEDEIIVVHEERLEREYDIPITARLLVQTGQEIEAGDMITEGSLNPHEIMAINGVEAVRRYMLIEIQRVYRSQGVAINDKHIEVMIRQMLRRVSITDSGDSELLPGELADRYDLEHINADIIEQGGEPATAEPVVLGITKAALNTDSFLSAASFQHTISVLASAAIEGRTDDLIGLKESVLIGKLIPAGTGFGQQPKAEEEPQDALAELGALEDELGLDLSADLASEIDPMSSLGGDLLGLDPDGDLDALDKAFLAKTNAAGTKLDLADLLGSVGGIDDDEEDEADAEFSTEDTSEADQAESEE